MRRLPLLLPFLLCLLASCDLLGGETRGSGDLISTVNLEGQVLLIDRATGTTEESFRFPAFAQYLRWSPSGDRVAYAGQYASWEGKQIYVADLATGERRVISLWEHGGRLEPHGSGGLDPVWSPDGQHVAFTRCVTCEFGGINTEVLIVALDTTGGLDEVQVTDNPFPDYVQDWSPNGERLLIASGLGEDGEWDHFGDIYEVDAATLERRRILESDSTFSIGWARYSPSGEELAFLGGRDGRYDVYLANADGSDVRQVTDVNLEERSASWSPSGEYLAFLAERGQQHNLGHVYVIRRDGTGMRKLTSGEAVYGPPEWRPLAD